MAGVKITIRTEERDFWSGTLELVTKTFDLSPSEAEKIAKDIIRQLDRG